MQEKPTEDTKKETSEPEETEFDTAQTKKRRSYYYDDAFGYQEFGNEQNDGDDEGTDEGPVS